MVQLKLWNKLSSARPLTSTNDISNANHHTPIALTVLCRSIAWPDSPSPHSNEEKLTSIYLPRSIWPREALYYPKTLEHGYCHCYLRNSDTSTNSDPSDSSELPLESRSESSPLSLSSLSSSSSSLTGDGSIKFETAKSVKRRIWRLSWPAAIRSSNS